MRLTHSGAPLTVNTAISSHWTKREPIVKQWREDFFWLGKTIATRVNPPFGFEVYFDRCKGTKRQSLGDPVAHALLAKAAIDGLVDARVMPDDDGRYVRWVRFHAPVVHEDVAPGLIRLVLDVIEVQDM